MNEETLEALKGSIRKWEGIVAGTEVDHGEENCPLCEMFILKNCRGCPVYDRTGEEGCYGTPYRQTLRLGHDSVRYKKAAQAEVDFLRSLLPP